MIQIPLSQIHCPYVPSPDREQSIAEYTHEFSIIGQRNSIVVKRRHPIIGMLTGKKFIILADQYMTYRFQAAKNLGWETIDCWIEGETV